MHQGRHTAVPQLRYRIERPGLLEGLHNDLERILTWQFPVLGQGCHEPDGIVIGFADDDEFQRYVPDEPPSADMQYEGFDALGVYVKAIPEVGRCAGVAKILINLGKTMQAAQLLHRQAAWSMSVEDVHRILVIGVVIHELAHAMMDGQTGSLQAAADGWLNAYTLQYRFLIEESLAEACVLVQNFADDERDVIVHFLESAPPTYQAGFHWHVVAGAVPDKLMATMRAWRDHKALDSALLARAPKLQAHIRTLWTIAHDLREGKAPMLPVDFRAAFGRDVKRVPKTSLDRQEWKLAEYHLKFRHEVQLDTVALSEALQTCSQEESRVINDTEAIHAWVTKSGVTRYRIEHGVVHVDGDVDLSGQDLSEGIPVRFGRIDGHFDCSGSGLNSLSQLPLCVIGNVYCCDNPISSMEGLGIDARLIAGYLCLDGHAELSHAYYAVRVHGLQLIVASDVGMKIVNSFLERSDDDAFACQEKLIDEGHDGLAGCPP